MFYRNAWNSETSDATRDTIYRLNARDPDKTPIALTHIMPTTNISFQPMGLAVSPSNAELVFTNFGASISKINVNTGQIAYVAGPVSTGSPEGYQDGKGLQVQVGFPMGITTEKLLRYSYFVDLRLCNVRQLDWVTLQVTTLVLLCSCWLWDVDVILLSCIRCAHFCPLSCMHA